MGLKAQLGWMRHGAARTNAALEAYGTELRALQEKVEALTGVVRVEMMIEAMKEQLRTITDDLGDRIGAVAEQLDSTGPLPRD